MNSHLSIEDMAALVDAKNSALATLGSKIDNTDGIYTTISYSEYTIAYYEIMAQINNATTVKDVEALNLNELKTAAELKLVTVAKELADAKANKLVSLGVKLENSNTNIYTAESCEEYSKAFDAIISKINEATTLSELNAIDVNALKAAAEAKLVLVAQELSDLRLSMLTDLGAKMENVSGAYASASYAEYIVAYYEIISQINNASSIEALKAMDVVALKSAAEAKLSAMAPTTEETSKTDEVETKSTIDTEKKTEKNEENNEGKDDENQGCSSSVAISALAVIGIVGSALVIKKKED
jgi:hypothetical protein